MQSMSDEMLVEARSAFLRGDDRTAERLLQQLLLSNGRNPEIHQMLATICYNQGKFSKAIQHFKRALEIDPAYTDASVGLSIILNDLGKYDEGRRIFQEAQERLDKMKGRPDPWVDEKIASKHEELADLYSQYHRYQEALEQLFKAQKLTTRKAEITMRIADAHVHLGQTDRAIKDLRALVREYPHLVPSRLKLGLVLYNSNNIAEAVEQWENVLIRDPENPEALRYLKMAQAAGITSLGL
ncbi:MAG: tetratricopeptide repeat protein [Bdellovibrionaceae bacterium]|nr:tetratricopeptide repeat protein [Pseudobdellovibrionaceae bacterium]MBX3034137.1 tetratricopeptide repeat protein [Pseudobdellovibrionaceae bacterium]